MLKREAAEAFIASQKAEGWRCLPEMYDDGGFSGGNLERPAMKRLMDDIEADKVFGTDIEQALRKRRVSFRELQRKRLS